MKRNFLVTLIVFAGFSSQVFAWGGRGHAAVCEAAVYLVKNQELRDFLKFRPHTMAHLCNIPDIYWKALPSEVRKSGDPGHYINSEKIGLKFSEVPADYRKIIETYTGKPNKQNESQTLFSIPDEFGSSWWRADQFYRLALAAAKISKESTLPKGYKEEQNDELPFNKGTYQMMVNMGLLGHFVGDDGQPFHNTSDHDGYAANQGGIHSYYEEAVVAHFGPDLVSQIVKKAGTWTSQPFAKYQPVVENMRALSEVSASEIKEVLKQDPIIKPSVVKIEKGMSLKTPAERKPAAEGLKKFDKLIVKQMARSAYMLAYLWDQIYKEAGEPPVHAYRSYLYPFTPDFVKPDYYDLSTK